MGTALGLTVVLLLIAILVALAARRLELPYTVGLVIAGIGLALLRIDTDITLTHELVFDVILPPLLFEAALNIHWRELRRDMLPVLTLATFGVLIAAAIVAWGMHGQLNWPWTAALLFGVLISATDPVAVIAMFKDTGVTGRLRLLVEGESLLNDGVAAVFFAMALVWAESPVHHITGMELVQALTLTVGGGIAIGAACGAVAIRIAGRTCEHLVEATLTTITAYGSFLLAEHLHVSGVMAAVTAGLLMGNVGLLSEHSASNPLSKRGRAFILELWEFIAFLANSLIFLLIGLSVASIPFSTMGTGALLTAIALVLLSRAGAVYPLCLLFTHSRWAINRKHQHVLWWGGMRGAMAMALALSLPDTIAFHDQIVIATFGVVTFSVLAQGLTMPMLLKRFGLLPKASRR